MRRFEIAVVLPQELERLGHRRHRRGGGAHLLDHLLEGGLAQLLDGIAHALDEELHLLLERLVLLRELSDHGLHIRLLHRRFGECVCHQRAHSGHLLSRQQCQRVQQRVWWDVVAGGGVQR